MKWKQELVRTGLFRSLHDEIVDHHTQERVGTGDHKWRTAQSRKPSVDSSYDTLSSSFFVPRRSWRLMVLNDNRKTIKEYLTIDLAGEKQTLIVPQYEWFTKERVIEG
jgi:hypothetical protein